MEQRRSGKITVTDPRMTRFWITLEQGVRFVIRSIEMMHGGEVFVPKLASMNIMDLARAVAPGCRVEEIGIRAGEKVHEVLVSEDEARQTLEADEFFVIEPMHPWWKVAEWPGARPLAEGFSFASTNARRMAVEELQGMIAQLEPT
jgi:UDP-N-acetylglucosamine 4,6-dehydratase